MHYSWAPTTPKICVAGFVVESQTAPLVRVVFFRNSFDKSKRTCRVLCASSYCIYWAVVLCTWCKICNTVPQRQQMCKRTVCCCTDVELPKRPSPVRMCVSRPPQPHHNHHKKYCWFYYIHCHRTCTCTQKTHSLHSTPPAVSQFKRLRWLERNINRMLSWESL